MVVLLMQLLLWLLLGPFFFAADSLDDRDDNDEIMETTTFSYIPANTAKVPFWPASGSISFPPVDMYMCGCLSLLLISRHYFTNDTLEPCRRHTKSIQCNVKIERERERERWSQSQRWMEQWVLQKHIIHLPAAVSNSQGAENLCISRIRNLERASFVSISHSGECTRSQHKYYSILNVWKKSKRPREKRSNKKIHTHNRKSVQQPKNWL